MTVCTKAFDGTDREPMPEMRSLLRGALSEFMAMCLFVYFGCGAAASNVFKASTTGEWDPASVTIIALQFGFGIVVLAYATAHSSGGHINCAVTWALTLTGKCHPLRGIAYLFAQLAGSILGAALLEATTGQTDSDIDETFFTLDRSGALGANGLQNASVTVGHALVAEFMGTFLLVLVVLETAVNGHSVCTEGGKMVMGNKMNLAPLAIGLAVFLAHVVNIPITGCSINPTRSFGPALVANAWDDHWIWWVGPLSGATCAALVWKLFQLAAVADTKQPAADTKDNVEMAIVPMTDGDAEAGRGGTHLE